MPAAISLENVSKSYKLYPRERDRLTDALSFGRAKRGRDFWVLDDVSLEVGKGTSLGLLGRNGAGKSTMLQIVAGVLQPTSGVASTRGRISALLQLGAGFSPDFTGRENAMMNGLLLGLDRKEMNRRFDDIEEFADLGDFMNQPVKTYSSGMRARLGFAVAVNVDPEILLVDETLSVGDGVFRHMGIQKMRDLQASGATIVFVSHSIPQVKDFCTEAALLHRGRLISHGDTSETVDLYQALLSNIAEDKEELLDILNRPGEETPEFKEDPTLESGRRSRLRHGSGEVKIENVEILDERGIPTDLVSPDSLATVRVHLTYMEDVKDSMVRIAVRNRTGLDVFATNTNAERRPLGARKAGEKVIVAFKFRPSLRHGPHSVAAGVSPGAQKKTHFDWIDVAAAFEVDRPSNRPAFGGLAHLPTEVEVFEFDGAGNPRPNRERTL